MSDSWLIVGLGNPGQEYASTRHNAGFRTIDVLAPQLKVVYWKTECGALTAKGKIAAGEGFDGVDVVLAKPQAFMNLSGGPVKQLCAKYDVSPERLIVIHDELDIEEGTLRVKFGGGHAGHNGLRSICDKLGTRDWYRVRVGIGRPPGRMQPADYVLTSPRGDAADLFADTCTRAADAVVSLVRNGLEKTQQTFNS